MLLNFSGLRWAAAACVNKWIPEVKQQSARSLDTNIYIIQLHICFCQVYSFNPDCIKVKTLIHKKSEGIKIQKLLDGLLLCDSRLRDGGGLLGHCGNDPLRQFIMFWTGGSGWRWNRGFRSGCKTQRKIGLSQCNTSRHMLPVPFCAITSWTTQYSG